MTKKTKAIFVCENCGASFNSWAGKCASCGEWNTLVEQVSTLGQIEKIGTKITSQKLNEVVSRSENEKRFKSGSAEFDDVLGGGFVPGSVTLLAGQPGIGKSTILLQIANGVALSRSVLYVSGEESVNQVAMRAKRLGVLSDKLDIISSNSADDIASTMANGGWSLVIVDSIQTISTANVTSSAGSVGQITNSSNLLLQTAKRTNTALILVGHVTKEGSIAGPKVLEHVVDTVLQLEGDRYGGFKVLRSVKNRFGSTNESAIYEMSEQGLTTVDNPSAALLSERQVSDGSIVLATLEGARPLLVEVQALVNPTSYGYPKRASSGIDINRVNLLIAMLERRTKLQLADKDIYINIVGGLKISEPAADLAICMAIASAAKGMQLKKDAVVFGEVGLSGEVRRVAFVDKRLGEAKKMGFKLAIGPRDKTYESASYKAVTNVKDALNQFLEKD